MISNKLLKKLNALKPLNAETENLLSAFEADLVKNPAELNRFNEEYDSFSKGKGSKPLRFCNKYEFRLFPNSGNLPWFYYIKKIKLG